MKRKIAAYAIALMLVLTLGAVSLAEGIVPQNYPIDFSTAEQLDTAAQPFSSVFDQWDSITLEQYVTRAAQQIGETWRYADQVWPGVDYSNTQVIVTLTDGSAAWLIEPSGVMSRFPFENLPASYSEYLFPTYYSSSADMVNDKPTAFAVWDADYFKDASNQDGEFESLPSSTMLFPFITHEEFHHRQITWQFGEADQEKLYELGEQRSEEAMVMRYEMIDSLIEAYESEEDESTYLSAAKWWYDQYQVKFPEEAEVARPFDIIEGTARYFDMAMNARSILGMQATSEELDAAYKEMLAKDYGMHKMSDKWIDSESYELGGVACLLLARKGVPDWQSRIEQGVSPVDILLENVEAVEQVASPAITEQVQQILADTL